MRYSLFFPLYLRCNFELGRNRPKGIEVPGAVQWLIDFAHLNIHNPPPATRTKACPPVVFANDPTVIHCYLRLASNWNVSSPPRRPPNLPWWSTTRSHTMIHSDKDFIYASTDMALDDDLTSCHSIPAQFYSWTLTVNVNLVQCFYVHTVHR